MTDQGENDTGTRYHADCGRDKNNAHRAKETWSGSEITPFRIEVSTLGHPYSPTTGRLGSQQLTLTDRPLVEENCRRITLATLIHVNFLIRGHQSSVICEILNDRRRRNPPFVRRGCGPALTEDMPRQDIADYLGLTIENGLVNTDIRGNLRRNRSAELAAHCAGRSLRTERFASGAHTAIGQS
jgi:hypothetical protein